VKITVALSWLMVCVWFLLPVESLACRCTEPKSPEIAYQRATAVVIAEVVRLQPRKEIDGIEVDLRVMKAWKKKDLPQTLTIFSGTTCQYQMEPGGQYLLYLGHDEKMQPRGQKYAYTTGRCLGSGPLSESSLAVNWLREHASRSTGIKR
jgi:hypothetical protein